MKAGAKVRYRTPWIANLAGLLLGALGAIGAARSTETVTYYYTDQQGTVLAKADASGHVLDSIDYRPYGGVAGGAVEDGPGYTGHVGDEDSGLVYMQARYYDPQVGRFMSRDAVQATAGLVNGFNRYSYVANNPVSDVDVDGRQCAQCLYYPGDIKKQAITTAGADKKGLAMTSIGVARLIALFAPQLSPEVAPVAEEAIEASEIESEASAAEGTGLPLAEDGSDGNAFPDRPLPRDAAGRPVPEPDAEGAHTQLGRQVGRNGQYNQAREFDDDGDPVRDIDFTDHNRPANHPNPHQHRYIPNPTGGTPRHGPAEPLPGPPQQPMI